jgi:hypothetical protein
VQESFLGVSLEPEATYKGSIMWLDGNSVACITLYDVPDLHCFIVTPAGQQISIGVKIDTKDIVCVACKGLDTNSLSMKELRKAQSGINGMLALSGRSKSSRNNRRFQ